MFLLPLLAHALHTWTSAFVSCVLLRTVRSMCITAPWQNRWSACAGEQRQSPQQQHSQGGKGTDICSLSFGHSLSLLSYSTSKSTLLHSNAAPAPPPNWASSIGYYMQNIIIYIHKCHQNENYPDMNYFCCWCCLMSFKARHALLKGKIIANVCVWERKHRGDNTSVISSIKKTYVHPKPCFVVF